MSADPFQAISLSLVVCSASYLALLALLRRNGPSLALPFAYMTLLLLNHMPGAAVPLLDPEFNAHITQVETGIRFAAIGAVCFVIGVWFARRNTQEQRLFPQPPTHLAVLADDRPFWLFCLAGGWIFTFGLTPLRNLPSIGAVVYNGGTIWMLGVLLGLRWSVRNKYHSWTLIWFACLSVYPALILISWGFLSYGAAAVIIVLCVLTASARRYWRTVAALILIGYIGLSIFSNYFQARDNIRDAVWGGASLSRRIDAIETMFTQFHLFDAHDQLVLAGFDIRLNQNYFVGLSAENLANGTVQYLHGSSVTDALLSLIPRVLWPGKTVYGGSPEVVAKMTGLDLSTTTSFGVGNVMEFYINFGMPGLIGGFLLLGWALGRFDHRAALAETRGDYGAAMLFFLPGVALIQPIGSMVEMTGSAASAWVAAYFWRWAWARWQERNAVKRASAAAARP